MKRLAALAALAHLLVAWPARADEPKAIFVLDGETYEFGEVSAFRTHDRQNATQFQTFVLLTTTAPQRDVIAQARDPYLVAINDPATAGPSISFFVEDNGTISMNATVGEVQYIDSTGTIMMQPGRLRGECRTNTEKHITCSVTTPKPVETTGGAKWTLRADFDSEVLKREAGRQVDTAGGEFGKILTSLEEALAGGDLTTILQHLSESKADGYRVTWRSPEENLAAVRDDLSRFLPTKLAVIGGEYVSDDEVELQVRGVFQGTEDPVLYSVTMVRQNDRWGYDQSMFVGFPD